ncbi:MAG: cytochrome P450 [Cytophagales bacterium]|nr:cytochrome P450 [Armatimonadota bacterium]
MPEAPEMTDTLDTLPLLPVAPLPLKDQARLLAIFFGDRLQMLLRFAESGGELSRFRFASRYVVLANAPGVVGEALLEREADYRKGPALSVYSRPLLGNGLLTSEGGFHRKQRRLSAPAFAHRQIVGYAKPMAEAAERLQEPWTTGQTLDVSREMMRLTLGIVGTTLFGVGNLEDDADTLGRSLTTVMQYFLKVIQSPVRLFSATIPPWEVRAKASLGHLDATIYRLIADRRREPRNAGDLLSVLLLAQDTEDGETATMTDQQVRDEVMTLFLAGHETTSNALTWTWYLLAKHPLIYAKVQAEVDEVLGGRTPTYDDLSRLPVTLQVLKESLRLYPPVYAIVRQATTDTQLGGKRIPARAIVLVSPYLLHRRPETFPEPDRFLPERWTAPFEKSLPRHAYLPFGGGPRICIGAAFALMEGHLLLATLAQRITFRLPHTGYEATPEPLITLRPRGGLPLVVTRRTATV